MSFRVHDQITEGPRTITLLERREGYDKILSWEFQCDECDQLDADLTRAEAEDELENHECEEE